MASVQTRPYYLGEHAQLVPTQPTATSVTVTAPSGPPVVMDREGYSAVPVELTQVGVWRYQFNGEDERSFQVVPAPQTETPERVSRAKRWAPSRGV